MGEEEQEESIRVDGVAWSSSLPWFDGGRARSAGYARDSFERASRQAGLERGLGSFDFVELDDTYSFKLLQHLVSLAEDKEEAIRGAPGQRPGAQPIRWIPGGRQLDRGVGLTSALEAVLQLRGEAEARQVKGAQRALVQSWRGRPDGDGRGRDTLGGRMTNRKVAVIGAGMTLFRRRLLETGRELSYEASRMALDSAGMERKDIESVVIGSAPDAFDGVHMKGEYLLEGAGGHRAAHVAGSTSEEGRESSAR